MFIAQGDFPWLYPCVCALSAGVPFAAGFPRQEYPTTWSGLPFPHTVWDFLGLFSHRPRFG